MRLFTNIKNFFSILLVIIAFAGCDEKVSPNLLNPEWDSHSAGQGESNGHEWVDLGLPSGLKWATCNVGASFPERYGNYFAWGETETKTDYSYSNSLTDEKTKSELESMGIIDSSGNLTASCDAARANWGGSWRIPTKAEYQELIDQCTWIWRTLYGEMGYLVIGPNGKSLFLPAAGSYHGTWHNSEDGSYWSSTVDSEVTSCSYYLCFFSENHYVGGCGSFQGLSVRPVIE